MLYLGKIINKNNEENDKNWPSRMLIIGPSRKTNVQVKLMHYFI